MYNFLSILTFLAKTPWLCRLSPHLVVEQVVYAGEGARAQVAAAHGGYQLACVRRGHLQWCATRQVAPLQYRGVECGAHSLTLRRVQLPADRAAPRVRVRQQAERVLQHSEESLME